MATADPADLVERIKQTAQSSGAAEAEVFAEVSTVNEVRVRLQEVEFLRQSVIRGVGLRVLRDSKVGFMYTTDFQPSDLNELILRTIALAAQATPREENRFQDQPLPAQGLLDIFDATVPAMSSADLIPLAKAVEQNAIASDKRIQTVRSASAGLTTQEVFFTNTYIAYQTYIATTCSLGCTAVATDGTIHREGTYNDRKRIFSDLATPERIGKNAAQRALAKLGAKPVPSATVPVIFEAEAAGAFLRGLFGAFSASNVVEGRSYLAARTGTQVASPIVSITDNGILRRGLGSLPFDGEGTQTRRTPVVDRGTLVKFLHTTSSARRQGVPSTGNAIRSYDSLPVVGPTNFYVERGDRQPADMIKEVSQGLYVTGTAGFGIDTISGSYSQQAEGFWIKNGVLGAPVDGITIAGRLDDMLMGIDAVGKDLDYRSNVASPTLRFKSLTIGGT